jgi:hypothetical protein
MGQAREISRPLKGRVFGPSEDVGDKNGGARGLKRIGFLRALRWL